MSWRRISGATGASLCLVLLVTALAACGGGSAGTPAPSPGGGGTPSPGPGAAAPRIDVMSQEWVNYLRQLTVDLAAHVAKGDPLPGERWEESARETAARLAQELRQGSEVRRLEGNLQAPHRLVRQEGDWAWVRLDARFTLDGRPVSRTLDLALRWRDGAWHVAEMFVGAAEGDGGP